MFRDHRPVGRRFVIVPGETGRDAGSGSQEGALEIAAIGDSLTTGFHVSSPLGMIWLARARVLRNWFVDTSGSIDSVFERLGRTRTVVAYQYSTVAANVDSGSQKTLVDRLLATRHFSEQVTRVRRLPRFPDVVLVWIGHNNLDWAEHLHLKGSYSDSVLERLKDQFVESFRHQLLRLVAGAASARHPVGIVVFALVDFSRFFAARRKAEKIRQESGRQYPRFSDGYLYFASLRPEHSSGMIQLAAAINRELSGLVDRLCSKGLPLHVVLRYSTALHDADISSEVALSSVDAWHPSLVGHSLLAASAYQPVADVIASLASIKMS
jgi:hypothetical protein